MKTTSATKFLESNSLFYLVLGVNIIYICLTKFIPSMDGPAHLYNSTVLNHLITGNDFLKEYYSLNTLPIPNWVSHALMSFLQIFFPAYLAEKILHILYVAGMAISFRLLITALNPQNRSLSIFIFPFIYSFLFRLGFYNFCLSFIFFFSALYIWYHYRSRRGFLNYLILCVLLTAAYFSNILMFAFLGLVLGIFILYEAYQRYVRQEHFSFIIKKEGIQLLLLLLISLPGLVFSFIFYKNITFFPSDQSLPTMELLKWLYDARPFIVYNYAREKIITIQLLILLFVVWGLGFSHRRKENPTGYVRITRLVDLLIVPVVLAVFLLFVTASGSSAGMMSDRYCLMAFLFGLVWVIARSASHRYNFVLIIYVLVLHFSLLARHYTTIRDLNVHAESIHAASKHIAERSVVLPVNMSDGWLEIHFSNYLGVDKPMVILENYEASVGWFPLKWNRQEIPDLYLGASNTGQETGWITNPESPKKKRIDYVLLYGNTSKINEDEYSELNSSLQKYYTRAYTSEDGYVAIYKKK